MREEHNKLVRDRIPEIIKQAGIECETVILSENDYRRALREKLMEEAREVAEAGEGDLVKELGDLYEVIDAIMKVCNLDKKVVKAEQKRRRNQRGSFEKRICLLWTE